MKLWIRDKIWKWLGLTDKIEEMQNFSAEMQSNVRSLDDERVRKLLEVSKYVGEVESLRDTVKHLGECLIRTDESLSKRQEEINNLNEKVIEYFRILTSPSEVIHQLNASLQNRRDEIDSLIERFQNLDNEEVIRALHLRIEELENKNER